MATFYFENITASQAMSFTANDVLLFANSFSSAARTSVIFKPASPLSPETITITDLTTDRSVVFGGGIASHGDINSPGGAIVFQDGSHLFVGGTVDDDPAAATGAGDGLFGGQGDDTLDGGGGGDVLQGNQGNDSLNGGAATAGNDGGNDTIYGGQGNDYIDVGGGSNFGQGNLGADTLTAQGSNTASSNILLGGQGDDSIVGGVGSDILSGDLGNDTVSGGGGSDSIAGQAGDDSLVGSNGADTIDSGAGNDTVQGGGGADLLIGGSGVVRFNFAPGDSTPQLGQFDRITNWHLGDHLSFGLGPSGQFNFDLVSSTATDFNDAMAKANNIIGGGVFVAVPTAGDLIIFADVNHDHLITAADAAVLIQGKAVADIDLFTIL